MVQTTIIKFLYKHLLKRFFFLFDPEFIHDRMSSAGTLLGRFRILRFLTFKTFSFNNSALEQNILGVKFVNPVGLSAGFDKNAKLVNILPSLGFGHFELGSITLNAYEGNPKPRLYRLKKSKALVVYYGLKNEGVKAIVARIKKSLASSSAMGISVAKTNSTTTSTEEGGILDYFECLKYVQENNVGDYYTINISCPNTFGGEPFTTETTLEHLLSKVDELKISKPVFVKMPINLDLEEYDKLVKVCLSHNISGVVIGNLNKDKNSELIKDPIPENVKGGISGKPTYELSNKLIAYTYKNYGTKLKIVGVGGIFSAEDAYEKIKLGASLLQLITGMIFEGPQLIGEINRGLVKLLKKDGFKNISEAVGTGV